MYKNVLETIEGVGIFPIISMLIFFSIFMSAIVWFFKADKDHLQRMAELPLQPNHQQQDREE